MQPQYLKGIRVADFSWAGAGPFCTKIFSDFGAEVLKIESMTRPDSVRTAGPFKDGVAGTNRSGYFASRNTGKKSVSLNLKDPEARELALEIIIKSDVVANNFGPGVMERLGFGYEQLKEIKPEIICLSMPTCGRTGPRANLLGVGMTISAFTGMMRHTAYGPGDSVGPGTHYPDHAANPYHAAFAVLAALRYRRKTGKGMNIDLAQTESTANFLGASVVETSMTNSEPPQIGNHSRAFSPHNIYAAAGADEWVALAIYEDADWLKLCTAMGRPELGADPALKQVQSRLSKAKEIDNVVQDWMRQHTAQHIVSILRQCDLAVAKVQNSRGLVEDDEQLAVSHYFQQVMHPEVGAILLNSPPFLIDHQRVELKRPPLFGEHTDEVLQSLLCVTPERLASLRSGEALK